MQHFKQSYGSNNDLPPQIAQLWQSIYDPVILKALIQERNKKHSGQANGTPFTRDILSTISFSRTGPVPDSILNGTIEVD
jgi:hypothetical protein